MADTAEFQSRLRYLRNNYLLWASLLPTTKVINDDIARLRLAVLGSASGPPPVKTPLHPFVALAINSRAWDYQSADERQPIEESECRDACLEVAKVARPTRGRPPATVLIYHVQGYMALCAETPGGQIRASRSRGSVYEPRWRDRAGEGLEAFFRGIDPTVSRTQLVDIVRDACRTKAIAGRGFLDFFPFYGGEVDPETLTVTADPGFEVQSFRRLQPIYCP